MIEKDTVLVLGAGASHPFGFPLASGLRDAVLVNTVTSPQRKVLIEAYDSGSEEEIVIFNRDLGASNFSSVDAFLEYRPDLLEIGKLAIAQALVPCEKDTTFVMTKKRDWYGYLWDVLLDGVSSLEDFGGNSLKIVTFNYDRSLEHFLDRGLVSLFEKGPEEVVRIRSKAVPVIHIYGQLGRLPGEVDEARDRIREYEPTDSTERIRRAASGLRLVSEGAKQEFALARDWIKTASRLLIMGFGFHDNNLRGLGLHELPKGDGTHRIATGLGLTPRQAAELELEMQGISRPLDVNCLNLLRTYVGRRW